MDTNKTATATFLRTWTLSLIPSTGGGVKKNPDLAKYTDGDKVTITAIPNAGYVFDQWNLPLLGTNNPAQLTMTGNQSVKAVFKTAPPPVNHPAVASATVINGFVISIAVTDGGYGYPENPSVIISGGGGSGAAASATVLNGSIKSITVTDAGIGYTNPPTVVVLRTPELLNRNLIAYYPFDGNANDSSANGYNGTVVGAELTMDRFGTTNSAYRFTQGTPYIETHVDFKNSQNITVSAWVKFDSNYKGQVVFAQDDIWTGLQLGYNIGGNIVFFVGGTSGWVGGSYPTIPIIGKWYMLTGTYDGQKVKVFLDGVLAGTQLYSGGIRYRNDGISRIGDGVSLVDYPTKGSVDDVRIYSRALSDEDVALLYAFESPNEPLVNIEVKTVRIKLGGLKPGKKYQLESSKDLGAPLWSPVGGAFTATSLTTSQDVEVSDAGRYFRLYEVQQ